MSSSKYHSHSTPIRTCWWWYWAYSTWWLIVEPVIMAEYILPMTLDPTLASDELLPIYLWWCNNAYIPLHKMSMHTRINVSWARATSSSTTNRGVQPCENLYWWNTFATHSQGSEMGSHDLRGVQRLLSATSDRPLSCIYAKRFQVWSYLIKGSPVRVELRCRR